MGNEFICQQNKSKRKKSKNKSSISKKVNNSKSSINSLDSNNTSNSNLSGKSNININKNNYSNITENSMNKNSNTNNLANTNNNICLNNRNYFFNDKKGMNFIVHRNDGMNDFIIEINITKSNNQIFSKEVEFIMILDKSGSMGDQVHRLISRIIPSALNLLNYGDNDIIHLITFGSNAYLYNLTVKELKNNNNIVGSGGTSMGDVYKLVRSIFDQNQNKSNFRILALSDGMIEDQEKTKNEAEIIKTFIDATNFSISAGKI